MARRTPHVSEFEVESALYRVVQDSLFNIHKHASATRAVVSYFRGPGLLVVVIEDDGIGVGTYPGPEMEFGVGIPGMHAGMAHLGGTLESARHRMRRARPRGGSHRRGRLGPPGDGRIPPANNAVEGGFTLIWPETRQD